MEDDIAFIEIDDGKANVFDFETSKGALEGLKQAEANAKAVIIRATGNKFSAGFDLKTISGPEEAKDKMVHTGMKLLYEIYKHPQPVIAACNGHALGLGAFILLVSDTRIGAEGDYKIGLPETAGGMAFSPYLISILKAELTKSYMKPAALQSQFCNPKTGVEAGFLDHLVAPEILQESAVAAAQGLMQLPMEQYGFNKREIREDTLQYLSKTLAAMF